MSTTRGSSVDLNQKKVEKRFRIILFSYSLFEIALKIGKIRDNLLFFVIFAVFSLRTKIWNKAK